MKKPLSLGITLIIGFLLIIFIDKLIPSLEIQWNFSNKISAIILWITAIAIIWYTLEVAKSTKISLKPVPVLLYDNTTRKFRIENVGNNTAINVKIEDVILSKEHLIKIIFSETPVLRAGESKGILVKNIAGGKETNFPFTANLDPEYANSNFNIKITYQDIEGRNYKLTITTGKDGIKIYGVK